MANPEATNINGYYFKDLGGRLLIENEGATRQSQYTNLENKLNNLIATGLVPYAVDSTDSMTDTNRIYVLKSTGKWYYYNTDTTTWVIGGTYQAVDNSDVFTALAVANNAKVLDFSTIEWEMGGINQGTHKPDTQTDRFRSKTIIKMKAGSVIRFTGTTPTYQFKLTLFSSIPKIADSYISEPVAFADNASEYTLTRDAYVVMCGRRYGTTIDEEELPTLVDYFSTSTIYLADEPTPEPSDYNNILDNLTVYEGRYFGRHGEYYDNAGRKAYEAIPVEPGYNVRLFIATNSDVSDMGITVVCVDNEGAEVDLDLADYIVNYSHGVGYPIPANSKYLLISCAIAYDPYCRYTEKLDSVQQGIRLIKDGANCKLVAHSGLDGFAPEATIPAYTLAGQAGMWACKLDICETADGKFIMSHDATIDRMTDGTGNIIDMTLAELETYTVDAGNNIDLYPNEHLVTLETALGICKKYGMCPYIEFKNVSDSTSVASVVKILSDYGLLEQTLCQCSNTSRLPLKWLRMINKSIPIIMWQNSIDENSIYHLTEPLGNAVISFSAWNNDWKTIYTRSQDFGYPVCMAVFDTSDSVSRINEAIENYGLCLCVTSNVTPADIAPNIYTA